MKAIVFNIEKFATRDGPGIRTVVFLKGCPLRCMWCHSPESWSREIQRYPDGTVVGREMTADEVLAEVLRDRDFYEVSGGGLAVSGGEPLFRADFTAELLAKARRVGLSTAIETSGYAPDAAIDALLSVTNLWLYDIKGLDPGKHRAHVGVVRFAQFLGRCADDSLCGGSGIYSGGGGGGGVVIIRYAVKPTGMMILVR